MNIFLFLSLCFLFVFIFGRLIEKFRIPWVFSALILGAIFAVYNPFTAITSSETFNFLAELGMYFLLFMIGLEIDLKKFKESSAFILKSTFFIIFLEALFGGLLIHFVFDYSWLVSLIVSLSFATVGEAILIPILDEFKIINTKLGQSIIGIGFFDNLIELTVLIGVIFLTGMAASSSQLNIFLVLLSLLFLFFLTYIASKFKSKAQSFSHFPVEIVFLFSLFLLFLFVGIGEYAHATPIAALLAGIALKTFMPDARLLTIEKEIKALCYGFFTPIFFLWVGLSIDINSLLASPLLILLVVVVSKTAKILGSYLAAKKELGIKQSILLGIGLSVRFSTSIIIIKILFDNNIIDANLYSIIIASSIVFKFVVPILFSNLIVRWGFARGC